MSTDPSSQPTKPQLTKPQPSAPATQAAALQAPHSLCVLRLTALGDCINAFGLLGALKRTYPELELSWIIDARFAPLFCDEQGHDLITLHPLNFKEQGLKAILGLRKELTGQHYEALLNLQTSLKASLTSTVISADHKYGYDQERAREGHQFFITDPVKSPDNPHVLAGFMAMAEAAGYPVPEPYWDFKLDPYLIDRAHCLVSHEKKLCAIAPCSAQPSKNWTVEGYIEVGRYAQSHHLQVVLLGSHSELELSTCSSIADALPGSINLCGHTNLRELAALLAISKIVVAPDSACMHLASALGTPVIGLFACHDENRVGPWNFMDLNVSVYHKLAQSERKGKPIPWRYRVKQDNAMEHITPDMVLATFERALERYRI